MRIVQYYPVIALQDAVYDGPTTVGELKREGDFGLGTYNGLDGEMIVIDGIFYQVKGDGAVSIATDAQRSPWAMLTFFKPDCELTAPPNLDFQGLQNFIDQNLASRNHYFAFRIEGKARTLKTRALPRQTKPYPPLSHITPTQPTFEFSNVAFVGVGFRAPQYIGAIDPVGYHLHVLTKNRDGGGHVLEMNLESARICVGPIRDLILRMPRDEEFDDADLAKVD